VLLGGPSRPVHGLVARLRFVHHGGQDWSTGRPEREFAYCRRISRLRVRPYAIEHNVRVGSGVMARGPN
jgi:hypothetical protein